MTHFFSFLPKKRSGVTLIELIIFLGILGMVASIALPLLFRSTENRLLQQTISIVEQNGTQLLQTIGLRIHHAERVLDPGLQGTGSILALQMGSGALNPTIIGVNSGSLILIERVTKQTISSQQVAVDNFVVRNTSVSSSRQSISVSFRVSRTIRLQAPRTYEKTFEAGFTLYPDDIVEQACTCPLPSCGSNIYAWQVCESGVCASATTPLECS